MAADSYITTVIEHNHLNDTDTLYGVVRNAAQKIRDVANGEWDAHPASGSLDDYDISAGTASGGLWIGSFPVLAAGLYTYQIRLRAGGTPDFADIILGANKGYWNGATFVEVSAPVASTGDTAVTLTINDTGVSPLEHVEVWINTSNVRTGSVVTPQFTNASGEVVLYLDLDSTYYVFCQKTGYSFSTSANSIAPVTGTTSFTLSIGTAVEYGEETGYEESFLYRMIADTRLNMDEPGLNKKYSDAQIITKIEQAYTTVIGEVNRNSQTPVVGYFTLDYTSGTQVYQLPHHIGSVYAVYEECSTTKSRVFYHSDSRLNPSGRLVWMEGQFLHIQPNAVTSGSTLTVEFISNGSSRLHTGYLTNASHVDSDKTGVTIGTSIGYGTLDTHEHAYVGCVLRILGSAIEERVITAYDRTTGIATLEFALSGTYTSGNSYYEIAPPIHRGMDHVISLFTSKWIASIEGHTTRAAQLHKMYIQAIRTVRLQAYYTKTDESAKLSRDSYDHRRFMRRG